jgi:acyl-CoA reductase-like NAD-dependent aldehyde dehydrogenase
VGRRRRGRDDGRPQPVDRTGKLIARNAVDNLKRVHLELGGKAPMVVLDDADPATVAEAVKIGG